MPDEVSVPDSIEFLRQNGMDKLADGYGVHFYPNSDPHQSASGRAQVVKQSGIFSACGQGAKPCWLTEWAINNSNQSCPINDEARMQAVQAQLSAFKQFVEQGQIAAVLYYSWSGTLPFSWVHDTNRKEEQDAIYRCGALTDAGKLALSPF